MGDYPREADEDEWEATMVGGASPAPNTPAKRRARQGAAAGGKPPTAARGQGSGSGEDRPAIWDVFGSTENGKK